MKKSLLIFLAMFLPLGTFGYGLRAQQKEANKKERIFSLIERTTASVHSITSDFLEEKHMAMLQEAVFSRGKFYFEKPDRLRWELIEPRPSGFAVQGNRARRWQGQPGPSRVFEIEEAPDIKAFAEQVFAWANADFEQIEQGYRISVVQEDPVTLKLIPRSAPQKDYLNHLRLVFARDLSHVSMVEIHEADGDFTLIKFKNIVINGPRREDRLF